MGRQWQHRVKLASGESVGFSLVQRGRDTFWYVRFMEKGGKKVERSTGRGKVSTAIERAEEIIASEYRAFLPGDEVSWEEAERRLAAALAANNKRPATLTAYLRDLRAVRRFYGPTNGPNDITPHMAQTFRNEYAVRTYSRSKKKNAREFNRSADTVWNKIRSLSALWQRWFMTELHICGVNPWADVSLPTLNKRPIRYVRDEELVHFYDWLRERFNGWTMPTLFFTIKGLTGCRLFDLCAVGSHDLVDGRIILRSWNTKGRKERKVKLPADLFAELVKVAGPVFLWERHPAELRSILKAKGCPVHRLNPKFAPSRLYLWFENLMADYHRAFPDRERFGTHAFRKRAFTLAWQKGIDPNKASMAFGCGVDTMLKHYVDLDEQATSDEVMDTMMGVLNYHSIPTQKSETTTQNANLTGGCLKVS